METSLKNIGLLFTGFILMVSWAFSHSFFKLFGTFQSSNTWLHLHEIGFLFCFAMLVALPVLTRHKKLEANPDLKSFLCFLAPLLMFAMYYVTKEKYLQDVNNMAENENVVKQTICLPNVFAFTGLYMLALLNKENAFRYMRYTIAATLLLISLGLGYAFVVYIHFPFSMGISLSFIITDLILLTLMVNDKIYGYTLKPYMVSFVVMMAAQITWYCMPNITV